MVEAITALREKGVFASALIKKRKCWPKFIPGDEVIRDFEDKDVGCVDARIGTLNGIPFHLCTKKELHCIMQLMSMHGTLE